MYIRKSKDYSWQLHIVRFGCDVLFFSQLAKSNASERRSGLENMSCGSSRMYTTLVFGGGASEDGRRFEGPANMPLMASLVAGPNNGGCECGSRGYCYYMQAPDTFAFASLPFQTVFFSSLLPYVHGKARHQSARQEHFDRYGARFLTRMRDDNAPLQPFVCGTTYSSG